MSWFFDKDDPFAVSLREFCVSLPDDKPDNCIQVGPWNKGKTLTEEHKRLIGEAMKTSRLGIVPWNKGKKIDTSNYRKTRCTVMHPDGTLEYIESMKDFCIKHGLSTSNMCLVAKGKQSHHKGYKVIK